MKRNATFLRIQNIIGENFNPKRMYAFQNTRRDRLQISVLIIVNEFK